MFLVFAKQLLRCFLICFLGVLLGWLLPWCSKLSLESCIGVVGGCCSIYGVFWVVSSWLQWSSGQLLVHCYMAARQLIGVSMWLLSIC